MDPISAIAGVATAAGAYVLYQLGKAGLPKLVAAGSWLKAKLTAGKAELARLDGDLDTAFHRIGALEAQVAALAKAAGTGVGGQAVVQAVKTAAENTAPAFLQPKPDAPAPLAAAPAAQPQAATAIAGQ